MNEIEIKLKTLEMAKNISIESFFDRKEVERLTWEINALHAENTGRKVSKLEQTTNFPDESEVIKRAKTFNDFIFS
jgi:hypothetical protein